MCFAVSVNFMFILHMFCYFCSKNKRNVDFDQQTACGAPIRWSKYTTTAVLNEIQLLVPLRHALLTSYDLFDIGSANSTSAKSSPCTLIVGRMSVVDGFYTPTHLRHAAAWRIIFYAGGWI